jgi:hypothetical protein
MKYLFITFLYLISIPFNSFSQGKDRVIVDLKGQKWVTENKADKGVISLSAIPDVLTLLLPDEDFANYSIHIGPDSSKFTIGLNCTDDDCVKILLSDIRDKKIELRFVEGYLVGIGGRSIEKRKLPLVKGNLNLVILNKKTSEAAVVIAKKDDALENICDPKQQIDNQEEIEVQSALQRFHFLCYSLRQNPNDTCCATTILSPFDYRFLRPCLDNSGQAVTHKYRMVVDMSATVTPHGSPFTLLKMKKTKNYEYYKVKKALQPKAWREIVLTIIGKKDSVYKVSVTSGQNFMEYEKDFFEGLQALGTPKDLATTDSTVKTPTDPANAVPKEDKDKAAELKQKMTDLGNDLTTFNSTVYTYAGYSEDIYRAQLRCLQENMVMIFGFSKIPESGMDLGNELAGVVTKLDIEQYHRAFCIIIQSLKAKYEQAINLKNQYYVLSDVIRVPNEDEINIGIKTDKGTEILKERKFMVSGGFKIDFSTGFFHSGISASDFIVSPEAFRFKETRDTILPTGQDSVMYTGAIRDTSISVIQKNEKLSFGTGIYIHFYPRTGGAVNLGGAAGLILDNNGQVQFLLGGSLMFSAGKNRIALVGGYARGKEKRLSAENQKYYRVGGTNVFNSQNDLPKSFTGTNPTTFDKWKSSWFIGVTFNFASVPVGK